MGVHVMRLPDVGEGIAEAELVEWAVAVGDVVREDDVIASVMTDKATVEIPSSVTGKVIWLGGEVGDVIAIGAEIVRLEVDGPGQPDMPPPVTKPKAAAPESAATPEPPAPATAKPAPPAAPQRSEGEKPLAAPSVRRRAMEAGVDLRRVAGSGPAGRILHEDLGGYLAGGEPAARGPVRDTSVKEIKVVGLRRKIAERLALANARIPHITIVEEIDMTAMEELRAGLNEEHGPDRARLTLLPFLIRAIVKAVGEQPELNAHYDDDAGVIRQFGGVHIGIATQTDNGLMVPVAHHAEAMSLWDAAAEVARLAEAARTGAATREELTGSTITITSLGPLGALASTPIINRPEVAIVGVNRMATRPSWDGSEFQPRKMMNLSSSFDHRVIDGWDAAVFVQRLKTLLESPAMIFVEG